MRNTETKRPQLHHYNTRSSIKKQNMLLKINADVGELEFSKCLKKALNETITENDRLRAQIHILKQQRIILRIEVSDKTSAIKELGKCYTHCQEFHQHIGKKRSRTRSGRQLQ